MLSSKTTKNSNYAAGQLLLATVLFSFAYAILRYHILGPVPWKDFPFFIVNKGIALTGFILLVLNFTLGPLKSIGGPVPATYLKARKTLGMTGFLLVLIHVLMSFILFKPTIYGQFFLSDGTLTFNGGLSMLGGVLAFVTLWAYNLSFQTFLREDTKFIQFITSRRFMLGAMLLTLVHLFFMGYKGWMNPSSWHGGLPPISLISFVLFFTGYIINLLGRK